MDLSNYAIRNDYATYIACELATDGGHLTIGRGDFTLWFGQDDSISGYNTEPIKNICIAAGLPVIDSSAVNFRIVARLAINGPLVAVGGAIRPSALPCVFTCTAGGGRGIVSYGRRDGVEPGPHPWRGRSRRGRGVTKFRDGFGGRERVFRPPVMELPT